MQTSHGRGGRNTITTSIFWSFNYSCFRHFSLPPKKNFWEAFPSHSSCSAWLVSNVLNFCRLHGGKCKVWKLTNNARHWLWVKTLSVKKSEINCLLYFSWMHIWGLLWCPVMEWIHFSCCCNRSENVQHLFRSRQTHNERRKMYLIF